MTVAKDILDAYFYGKTVDENGNLVMPSAADQALQNTSSGASSSEAPQG
jgi:penicillin-binding protein 2